MNVTTTNNKNRLSVGNFCSSLPSTYFSFASSIYYLIIFHFSLFQIAV